MIRQSAISFYFIVSSVVVSNLIGTLSARADDPFSVGAILPLSGDSALGGQACLNGMILAARSLEKQGNTPIRVVGEDNASSPTRTVSAYQKLKSYDGIRAVVAWEDSAGLALAPLTERDKTLLVVTGGDRGIVENREHAFLYWLMLETEVEAIVSEIGRRGYKRIARIVTQHPGPIFMKGELDKLNQSQIQFVVDEEIPAESRDFRAELLKIKAAGEVDAILAFIWPGQIGLFAKQARNLGIESVIIGTDIFEDDNELKLASGALEGAWFPQIADPLPEFKREYEAAFPGASIYSAGNCHDIVMLIAESLKLQRKPSEFFANVKNFAGALGPVSASGDRRFVFPLLIREVRDGRFVTASDQ